MLGGTPCFVEEIEEPEDCDQPGPLSRSQLPRVSSGREETRRSTTPLPKSLATVIGSGPFLEDCDISDNSDNSDTATQHLDLSLHRTDKDTLSLT